MKWIKVFAILIALEMIIWGVLPPQFNHNHINSAVSIDLEWIKKDTMDDLLKIITNKASDNEAFMKWALRQLGTYSLEYYTQDHIRTTITFQHAIEGMTVRYRLDDMSTGTNITQSELDKSYAEMDFTLPSPSMVSKIKTVTGGALELLIPKDTGSKYPGSVFVVNNVKTRIYWSFQENMLYFMTEPIEKGNIYEFKVTSPEANSQSIKILRSIKNFNVEATHWIMDATNHPLDLKVVDVPSDSPDYTNEIPGSKPGLRVVFDQPKILNPVTYEFEYLTNQMQDISGIVDFEDIGTTNYTDMSVNFNAASGQVINPPNTGADLGENTGSLYHYDPAKHQYRVELVKDKSPFVGFENDFVQWSSLDSSRLFNISLSLEESPLYQFAVYKPEGGYGYTYLDYMIKRASLEDAYLDINPYGGSAQEEVEYAIYYSKNYKENMTTDDIWLKHYQSKDYVANNIYIPVPFRNGSNQEYYQVGVGFANGVIKSQMIKYLPVNDTNVPPPVPRIDKIQNLVIVPDPINEANPKKIQFDLFFTAPQNTIDYPLLESMLDAGDIYYELMANDIPDDIAQNPFTALKVFRVYKDLGNIKIQEIDTGSTVAIPYNIEGYSNGYNYSKGLFGFQSVVLIDENGWAQVPNINLDLANVLYEVAIGPNDYDFEYPGINFLKMRAVYLKKDGNDPDLINDGLGISENSVTESLTLSPLKFDVPITSGLDYDTRIIDGVTDYVGVTLTWDSVDATNFENYMVYPLNRQITDITYRVYITQDKSKLQLMDANDVGYIHKAYDQSGSLQFDTLEQMDLRLNGVYYFDVTTSKVKTGRNELIIDGLDKNTNYFTRIMTIANTKDMTTLTTYAEKANHSNTLSMTTPIIPVDPSDSELIPVAVSNLTVSFIDDKKLSTNIKFEYPIELLFEEDKFAFEILAVEDQSILLKDEARTIKFDDLIINEAYEEVGLDAFRLYISGGLPVLREFDFVTNQWVDSDNTFALGTQSITITDNNNKPNKVYYYYVRSIKIKGLVPQSASSWVKKTVTTAPISSVINLIVDYSNLFSIEPKVQSVIRFDAPIASDSKYTTDSKDTSTTWDYIIEVHVKSEQETVYSTTKYPATFLKYDANGVNGYSRLYYRIDGLSPGKTYDIKVRIEDRTKLPDILPDGSTGYPKSSFSEIVLARTDFDQSDYDKENKYNEYIQYYLTRAKELSKELSYTTYLDGTTKKIKYKQIAMEGQLQYYKNQEYLIQLNQVGQNAIIFSNQLLKVANDNNVTLLFETPHNKIRLRANTFTQSATKEIQSMVDRVNNYNLNIEDYYLEVSITEGIFNSTIFNQKPASPLVDVRFRLLGNKSYDDSIDTLIQAKLDTFISLRKIELIAALDKELKNGISDTKLNKIVDDTLSLVKSDLIVASGTILNSYLDPTIFTISNYSKPVLVETTIINPTSEVIGYIKKGTQFETQTYQKFSDQYVVEAKVPAQFIYCYKSSTAIPLDSVYGGKIASTVNQLALSEIFSDSELSSNTFIPLKYQVLKSSARLLDATVKSDEITYLRNQGISITNGNEYESMTRQDGLAILMDVYSKRFSVDLSKVSIKNYSMTSDLNLLSSANYTKIQAGLNLGLIKGYDNLLRPNEPLTQAALLEMLTRINNQITW